MKKLPWWRKLAALTAIGASCLGCTPYAGVEVPFGYSSTRIKTPAAIRSIDVDGPFYLSGATPDFSTVRVNNPLSKTFPEVVIGLSVYAGVKTENALGSFRIGIEPITGHLNFSGAPTSKGENGSYILSSTDWNLSYGSWPKAGVYVDIKEQNYFFIEKDLVFFGKNNTFGEVATLALLVQYSQYDVKWKSFTTDYPAGDGWYDELDDSFRTTRTIHREKEGAWRLGLRMRKIFEGGALGFGVTYGLDNTDYVKPGLEAKFTAGKKW